MELDLVEVKNQDWLRTNSIIHEITKRITNINRKEYAIVNLETLNKFEDGATVNAAALKEAGIIKKELDGVKVLGNGAIEKKLTVQAAKFSKSAVAAIEAAGGKTEVI